MRTSIKRALPGGANATPTSRPRHAATNAAVGARRSTTPLPILMAAIVCLY